MKISLRRRYALMVADGACSHKIDYVTILNEILNPEGHPNRINGLKVTAILLIGWILPISGASSRRVCACSLRSRPVSPFVSPRHPISPYHPTSKHHLQSQIKKFICTINCWITDLTKNGWDQGFWIQSLLNPRLFYTSNVNINNCWNEAMLMPISP